MGERSQRLLPFSRVLTAAEGFHDLYLIALAFVAAVGGIRVRGVLQGIRRDLGRLFDLNLRVASVIGFYRALIGEGPLHRWMVSCNHAPAQRQEKSFQSRLDQAEEKLSKLKVKSKDSADSFRLKAEKILQAYNVEEYLRIEINETITPQKKYIVRGRPGPKTPFEMEDIRNLALVVHRNERQSPNSDCSPVGGFL